VLAAFALAALALAVWAYRFAIPPLPAGARGALTALRALATVALLLLLAQPVLERARRGEGRVVVLVDRSASMDLPAAPGGPPRAEVADAAVADLRRAWRGRATVEPLGFAAELERDTTGVGSRGMTALGDALTALARSPRAQSLTAVVVVSDGVVNAGADPAAAARALGVPVHVVTVGERGGTDRALAALETSEAARVGEATTVRVRVSSTEPAGTPLPVVLEEQGRVLARATVSAPGDGAEAEAELRVTPARPGLALWTARVDALRGEVSAANNERQVAVQVAPGRLGVLLLSGGLNWDVAAVRRALAGDSGIALTSWVRARDGWRVLEQRGGATTPDARALRGQAVVVLDAIAPGEVGAGFDRALAGFVRDGGGLLLLGGPPPGITRFASGSLGPELRFELDAEAFGRAAAPLPTAAGRELTAWDDDPARADRAWRAAAPLGELAPIIPGAGDRVLIDTPGDLAPLFVSRRVGRGPVLFVNGTGLWRWSLNSLDDLAGERGERLWRRIARWLAEPVQGEPLRVRPERRLAAAGEPVRLLATLQDSAFRPLGGARVEGEVREPGGGSRRMTFEPGAAGSYVATLAALPPGRYTATVRATRAGRELGRAAAEFAVDRWSLEAARTEPDSAALAALARATGGRATGAGAVGAWARGLETRELARGRSESTRLWESPWVFALVIGALGLEWAWRRRRGLP
jgi:hypothetical protein